MHHIHPLESCLARILVKDTDQPLPSGTGVALHGERVLTCAHVVNSALKLPRNSKEKPEEVITLDFPLSGSDKIISAKVGFWDYAIDLAELIISEPFPLEVIPTSMHIPDELWDHRVQAFGFPGKNLDGTWADCQLRGRNTRGWVEVFDPKITGNFIRQGFSGGPVWDSILECVVGIIVAVEKNDESRVGYLIPAHKILEKWQECPISLHKSKPSQKKEIPDLIPYLVNRQHQEDDLYTLYKKNNPQSPLPMVAVVHGNDTQAQDMFHLKMASYTIPRLLKINLRQTSITEFFLSWPSSIKDIKNLSLQLTRALSKEVLGDPEFSCEDIQRVLAVYGGPVIIETELMTKDWVDLDENGEDILAALLDFWNNWPPLVPRQNLFIFIYVTHKIPHLSQNKRRKYMRCKRKIYSQLSQRTFDTYRKISGMVLSELTNISETETRHWARTVAQGYFHGEITMLIAKIRKLFENEETLAMEALASQLKEILTSSTGD